MKIFLLVVLSLISFPTATLAYTGTFVRYGLGIFNNNASNISIGYSDQWFGPIIQHHEVGGWIDKSGNGRRSSAFVNTSIGVESNPGRLVLRSLLGVGLITSPDSLLGGIFQVNQDLFVGIRGYNRGMIGLNYKHISSMGIYKPDIGRDMLYIQLEIPW